MMTFDGAGLKPVGIEDVARAASVSITTVSHALSGRGQVAEATRERVRRVADELGYAPNRMASGLKSRRSQIVGLVSDDIATTPFATGVVLGAQDAASERGQLLVVVNSNRDSDTESKQLSALLAAQIDAIVYARMFHEDSTELPQELTRVPSALVDITDPRGKVRSVVPDEEQIGRLATETLLAAGHRSIVHFTLTVAGPGTSGRARGYEAVMRGAGLQGRTFTGGDSGTAEAGRIAFAQMMEAGARDTTAVFCFNDPMAMGVYQAAIRLGVNIPADLSVVSVDNFEPVANALLPGLTTVALPHYAMGRWAVTAALDEMESKKPDGPLDTRLPGYLVTRKSVAAPRMGDLISR
ncbi:LacI family DNA-binding transcriptional regulator [Arthrobacter sp. Soc17.1.1.1]|uniref:LacI family DNA-binding transcriptional regulator n=1 Tax=Arthrobacter sp. Soc17.1.1.1 TaxID=3121277 RepID=UPI002FE482F2